MQVMTEYEKTLAFNSVTAWLHSFRYRHALKVLEEMRSTEPVKVVDIGCAHAKFFEHATATRPVDYIGIEIRDDFVQTARERYDGHPRFRLMHESATTALSKISAPDLIVALETLEHIPEGDVVRIVERIAAMRPRRFLCSVPVEVGPAIWMKNVGSLLFGYCRHQEYTWPETFWAGLYQLDRLPAHGVGHKGFDWRWLAQTIRHNMRILAIRTFPVGLPAGVSTSVFIVAEPR